MSEVSADIMMTTESPEKKILLVNAIYRYCLIDLGYSPDCHLEDIDVLRLRWKQSYASSKFLQKVLRFYDSLPSYEQRYFYTEVLERNRHYKWWWIEYGSHRLYELASYEVKSRITDAF
jgi:hypothetical protein